MSARITYQRRRLSAALTLLAMLLIGLTAVACDAAVEPLATPTPAPELRLEIQTEQVGPNRTNVILVVTNIGLTDVLVETALDACLKTPGPTATTAPPPAPRSPTRADARSAAARAKRRP